MSSVIFKDSEECEDHDHESRLERKLKIQRLKSKASSLRKCYSLPASPLEKSPVKTTTIKTAEDIASEPVDNESNRERNASVEVPSPAIVLYSPAVLTIEERNSVSTPKLKVLDENRTPMSGKKEERKESIRKLKSMADDLRRRKSCSSIYITTSCQQEEKSEPKSPIRYHWSADQTVSKKKSQLRIIDDDNIEKPTQQAKISTLSQQPAASKIEDDIPNQWIQLMSNDHIKPYVDDNQNFCSSSTATKAPVVNESSSFSATLSSFQLALAKFSGNS
mmetsp:Transcript_16910/g.25443  ORF Transcript_16910/g.25443 Transcript_16910/m.25443 type:complete len:277 (+) Transcript_16910:70-900(+)|eukprot:CAMPEP_0197317782 /NCGR_PEP_ID=MMETSP0891-20130614/48437_1 /TAXON_ID=44058 ORGANISM="Aureoumbra lagunensis, Strain CCMP1510" /NCGR_SAMPLE_ID=MMETSP0891 /ASSEMBLY_ACC=CAM_ASM_000534 /LENGTH=276 /DNA_ID=CAMNT_0042807937 /DNA_START=52 /DNA_END=882 /DNA_ORIENTATION=-